MKSAVLYCLLLLSVITAAGQRTSITDSLAKQLALSKADSNRVMLLKTLAQYSHRANPDKARQLLEEALLLAKRLRFEKGKAECLLTQGIILEQEGHYPKALEVLLQSKNISGRVNDMNLISRILRAMGNLYASQGDYAQAMAYLFQAKSIQEKIQPKSMLATTLKIIGEVYFEKNQLDSSLVFLNQSYQMLENRNDVGLDDLLTDLGQVQAAVGNDAKAMRYFRSSVPYSIADNDGTILNKAFLGIARLFHRSGGADSCIYYSRKALEAAQEINYSKGILAASQLLSEVYAPIDEHEAFRYYRMATAVKDSVFNAEKAKQVQNLGFVEQQRLQSIEANRREYRNQVKVYALLSAVCVFLLIALFLWRNNRYKQKAKIKIEKAYEALKAAQAQLVQREKMASLGELTAGIAHEIQNPLNFINNFSEVNKEMIAEMKDEIVKGNYNEVKTIADSIAANEEKIYHHGARADTIVKGMLQHSQSSKGQIEPTDINALVDEYLRLSYHGLRSKDNSFYATFKADFDESIGKVNIIPQDIGRVLLNLYNNAFYSMHEKKKLLNEAFEPTVLITTKRLKQTLEVSIKDNGTGIPEKVVNKIYQPFFTTKPTGQGTGLGLSLSYEIIKTHGGEIKVETREGEYANFIVILPLVS